MTDELHLPRRLREKLLDVVLLDQHGFHGAMDGMAFLERIWDLTEMPSTDRRYSHGRGDIRTHWASFDDWDDEYLLVTRLSLLDDDDAVFAEFVELCIHPRVLPDSDARAQRIEALRGVLDDTGWQLKETGQMGEHTMHSLTFGADTLPNQYDVALSFAGEQRDYVGGVAAELVANDVSVFYDEYETADLWGKDMVEHLDLVYRKQARYVIMFVSKEYAEKAYPTHERRSALARAIKSRQEYILPVRFDFTDVPGLHPTILYLEASKYAPAEVARLTAAKLRK